MSRLPAQFWGLSIVVCTPAETVLIDINRTIEKSVTRSGKLGMGGGFFVSLAAI
jgi:hypothetical protein